MVKSEGNTEPQPFILFSTLIFYHKEEKKIEKNLKISWIPEGHSKIFVQKRAVSESNLKKNLLKQHFFAEVSMIQLMLNFK